MNNIKIINRMIEDIEEIKVRDEVSYEIDNIRQSLYRILNWEKLDKNQTRCVMCGIVINVNDEECSSCHTSHPIL